MSGFSSPRQSTPMTARQMKEFLDEVVEDGFGDDFLVIEQEVPGTSGGFKALLRMHFSGLRFGKGPHAIWTTTAIIPMNPIKYEEELGRQLNHPPLPGL